MEPPLAAWKSNRSRPNGTTEEALGTVEELWGAEEDTREGDRLDVLIALVEAYEAVHHSIYRPDPIAAIEFHMDQNGLTRSDLEK